MLYVKTQKYLRLSDLKIYLGTEYNIVFSSEQSYYNLLKAAQISWKKTQKKNPARNDKLVTIKKKEIKQKLENWHDWDFNGKPGSVYDWRISSLVGRPVELCLGKNRYKNRNPHQKWKK